MKSEYEYYKNLKTAYPNWMSKEQFRKEAHISKATALYLLESGVVPCKKTDGKTRCYRIKTTDVIAYLQDRILCPERYRAQEGWYADRSTARVNRKRGAKRDSMILTLSEEQTTHLFAYFKNEMDGYEDLLTVEEIALFLGYGKSSVTYWCHKKGLKHFSADRKYLIPKICFLEFLVSPKTLGIRCKSYKHKLYLADFMRQEKTK